MVELFYIVGTILACWGGWNLATLAVKRLIRWEQRRMLEVLEAMKMRRTITCVGGPQDGAEIPGIPDTVMVLSLPVMTEDGLADGEQYEYIRKDETTFIHRSEYENLTSQRD